mgnify:CR=1 FL=1
MWSHYPKTAENGDNNKNGDEKMKNDTTQMMLDVVECAGGIVSREDYIQGIMEMQRENGYDYANVVAKGEADDLADAESKHYSSVKSNCFNTGRMLKAGVRKVIIGTSQKGQDDSWFVVTSDLADQMNAGGVVSMGNASMDGMTVQKVQAPAEYEATVAGDVFYGIPARDADNYPVHIAAKITQKPTGYIEQKGELQKISSCFKKGHHFISKGPTGCGKTLAIFEFSHRTQIPVLRFNAKDGMTWADLVGTQTVTENENGKVVVGFQDGILTKAMRYGCILYIDEITFGDQAVLGGLNEVMDDGTLYIPDTGEMLKAHDDFRIFASHNPAYDGTKPLNQATRSRFAMGVAYDYLAPELETQVIQAQSGVSNPEVAKQLVAFANICRDQRMAGELETDACSTRTLVTCMDFTTDFSLREAMEMTIFDQFSDYELETAEMNARAIIADF